MTEGTICINIMRYLRHLKTIYVTPRTHEVTISTDCLRLKGRDGLEQVHELKKVRRVVFIGKPRSSAAPFYDLAKHGIPIDLLDLFGRPIGELCPHHVLGHRNATLQERLTGSVQALEISKRIIIAKVRNCSTVLKRHHIKINQVEQAINSISEAQNHGNLRGHEGFAAKEYFGKWKDLTGDFPWPGRRYHPAIDPVNSVLSLGYTLLRNRLTSSLRSAHLDPRLGFFHRGRGLHDALSSDLMESMRPIIDATVLRLIHLRQITVDDFRYEKDCPYPRYARHETFSTILNAFEDAFERPRKITLLQGDLGKRDEQVSINEFCDATAIGFAQCLRVGGTLDGYLLSTTRSH